MAHTNEKLTELHKLKHILADEGDNEFSFLEKLEFEELTLLRQRLQMAIYMEQSTQWKRLAGVAKFMPNFANAKVAEQVLGASITANMSYFIDVRDAVSIMRFLSIPFMAEVAQFMIPDKCKELINQLPMDTMKKLVNYLLRHDKHFVVGSFVEVTSLSRVIEIAKHIEKEEDLVKITQFVQNKESLAGVFKAFPEYKRLKLIEEAHRLNALNIVVEMAMFLPTQDVIAIAQLLTDKKPHLLEKMLVAIQAQNVDGKYTMLIRGLSGN